LPASGLPVSQAFFAMESRLHALFYIANCIHVARYSKIKILEMMAGLAQAALLFYCPTLCRA
jgi:hypothetical protein